MSQEIDIHAFVQSVQDALPGDEYAGLRARLQREVEAATAVSQHYPPLFLGELTADEADMLTAQAVLPPTPEELDRNRAEMLAEHRNQWFLDNGQASPEDVRRLDYELEPRQKRIPDITLDEVACHKCGTTHMQNVERLCPRCDMHEFFRGPSRDLLHPRQQQDPFFLRGFLILVSLGFVSWGLGWLVMIWRGYGR